MPKVTKGSRKKKKRRHDPLEKQIADHAIAREGNLRKPRAKPDAPVEAGTEEFLPERLSKKVLQQAQAQQEEEKVSQVNSVKQTFSLGDSDDEDEDDLLEAELEEVENIEITEEDERELSMFMPASTSSRRTLADIIMEKIKEKEEAKQQTAVQEEAENTGVDTKIVQVYTDVGSYLAQYTSGKIPKPFKIIPTLKNWEHMLYLTVPEKWTANAMFYATKMFASSLNPKMAQRFYYLVLYPRVRMDIEKHKRLNYHLYAALKKAVYKPSAFFRGFVLPLAQEECTAREAIIVSSVLAKISIPAIHSAVAILKLAEMEYSGPSVLFITTLINKKYSLPHRVIDQLVEFFARFERDQRRLPVCWHQALLTFVQRYKTQMTTRQKGRLKAVMKVQIHNSITPEIRRELNAMAITTVGMEM
jgi:essential nuclear protein 1